MVLINEFDLLSVATVNSFNIREARKNIYRNEIGSKVDEVVINGDIILNCSIDYDNNQELVDKLNKIQPNLVTGHLVIDEVFYDVTVLKGLDGVSNFRNFDLVFSWNGNIIEDGIKKYIG